MRPCTRSVTCAEPCLEDGEPLLGRSEVAVLGFLDQRAHPIDLPAFGERAADRLDHLVEPRERDGPRIDRLAAGRLLPQFGRIHVAEERKHERARDRRRRHHQHVDGLALARQGKPLVDAEAVLLVDDRKREVVELDLVLKQRMRADQNVDFAARKPVQDRAAVAAALAARQDRDLDADGGRQRRDGAEMLPRQELRRRHQRRLPPAFDHRCGRQQRHNRLAGAHIALQQPQHALGLGKIRDDVGDRAGLGLRERIGQRRDQLLPQLAGTGSCAAGRTAQMRAHERERKLAGEQFVIREPRPRRSFRQDVCRLGRPVHAAQRLPRRSATARARSSLGPATRRDRARASMRRRRPCGPG